MVLDAMSSENPTTRNRILDAAWQLLEQGAATRMADIAKAAGISRQALYLHFPNRTELLIATVRHVDEVKDIAARLAPSRAAASGPERLEAYVAAWAGYIPQVQGVARALIAAGGTDEAAAAAWADRLEALHHGWRAAVAALAADGVLAPGLDEARAADLLWALVSVETWVALVERQGWTQAAFEAEMIRAARAIVMSG